MGANVCVCEFEILGCFTVDICLMYVATSRISSLFMKNNKKECSLYNGATPVLDAWSNNYTCFILSLNFHSEKTVLKR